MIELKEIPLSRILKLDLRFLLEEIISTLEGFDLEAMRLQNIYEVLKKQEVKMQIIDEPYGKHDLTDDLAHLHKKRLRYGSLIYMELNAKERVDCEETQRMAKIAKKLAKEHLTYLGQKSLFDVRFSIDLFFGLLDNESYSEELEAFVGLGLQTYMDELRKANVDYKILSNQREWEKKHRPPAGDLILEKETKRYLQLFFDQLNSYKETFLEVDYDPLIKDINVTLTAYSKLIKTRIATNKRRARKKALADKKAAAMKLSKQTIPEIKPEAKPEDKPENKLEVKPENKPDAELDAKPIEIVENNASVKSNSNKNSKVKGKTKNATNKKRTKGKRGSD